MTHLLLTVLALAAGWTLGYHTRARTAAVIAEATARPTGPHPTALADEVALGWQALAEACCLRWWESGGRDDEHDPATCTRKDQTT